MEELELRMPTPVEAESLMVPSGVPVARVIRTAYDLDEGVEVLVSVVQYRHRFVYEIACPPNSCSRAAIHFAYSSLICIISPVPLACISKFS